MKTWIEGIKEGVEGMKELLLEDAITWLEEERETAQGVLDYFSKHRIDVDSFCDSRRYLDAKKRLRRIKTIRGLLEKGNG